MFNLSVLVTDAFMQAVKEDAPWELTFEGVAFKSLRARELWDKIMRATYAYAEPGVVFIDRINRRNNLHVLRNDPRQLTHAGNSRCRLTGPACSARSTWRASSRTRSSRTRHRRERLAELTVGRPHDGQRHRGLALSAAGA